MPLKVGISVGGYRAEGGGGWIFMALLLDALKTYPTHHKFIVLDNVTHSEASAGNDSSLQFSESPDLLSRAKSQSIDLARKVVPMPIRRAIDYFRNPNRGEMPLKRAIKAANCDVFWFMHAPGFPVDIPYIATVWDLEHRKQPYLPEVSYTGFTWTARENAYRAVLPRASFVITHTEVGKQEIIRFFGADEPNVHVIPYPGPGPAEIPAGRDPTVLRKYGIKGDYIFYPAQFFPHKNHYNLVQALDVLRKDHDIRINLVLTGTDRGNRRYVHQVIDELGLTEQVFDLGFVPRDDLRALYQNAVALVFVSLMGPDNTPPMEAFAWGCPVINSDIRGAKEQLGDAALLCRATDPRDIATKIKELMANQKLRSDLIAAGAAIASERTPRAYVARVVELLDRFEPIRKIWAPDYERITWTPALNIRWGGR